MNPSRDTAAIDGLIQAFFGAFDNRDGRVPTSAEIAALFIADAVILQSEQGPWMRDTIGNTSRGVHAWVAPPS